MKNLRRHHPSRPLRHVATALLAALVLSLGAFAATGAAGTSASAAAGPKTIVYRAIRPGLTVLITRRGDRVIAANVYSKGVCEDGSAGVGGWGFKQVPSQKLRIDRNGHFARSGIGLYFGGRFKGGKVSGVYFHTYRRNYEGETLEPSCGNIQPHGRKQRFVAKPFEVNGRRVHRG
jgi:hypothetical protein